MAARYMRALGTTLRGVRHVGGRWLLSAGGQTPVLPCRCPRLPHVSTAACMSTSSRTELQKSSRTEDRKSREEEEEEEEEDPDDIPGRKAKNPMMTIGYAWLIGLPASIIGFLFVKREVDRNRLKQLKVRQRMNRSNEGEFEGSRYRRHTDEVAR